MRADFLCGCSMEKGLEEGQDRRQEGITGTLMNEEALWMERGGRISEICKRVELTTI